jgi:Fe-S cluster assembly protein SufD
MISELKKEFNNFNKEYTQKFPKIKKSKERLEHFKKFEQLGFPNKKLEDWKFSDFNSILEGKFNKLSVSLDDKKEIEFKNYIKDFEHNKIVFFNGFYSSKLSHIENSKKNIASRLTDVSLSSFGDTSLNLLNSAFLTDGISLRVENNYEFKKPLVIYNIFDSKKDNNFFNQKITVDIGENSKLDLIILNINLSSNPIFLNLSNFFEIKKNGLFKLFYVNEFNNQDINYTSTHAFVSSNGIFENFIMPYKGGFVKNDISCVLKGNYSSGFINGAILARDGQHHEIKTHMLHQKENTKSYQKIKSVLDKKSKGIFQGKIYVDSKAQKTNGYQLSKAILLDKESEFDSKPELEIYADDVKCSHGSTSGNLDENSIFYLMSRGLSRQEAKKLLIEGFLVDAIETITNKEIKEYFLEKLKNKINEFK